MDPILTQLSLGYSTGKVVYCSICSKMFFRKSNPDIRCKCCNVKLRQQPRKATNRVRMYIS
jgi:hypothetical protein